MSIISIIIPVYNVEKYLRECLDSIINQTFPDIEIILVDDDSKDRSLDICLEYQKRDARVNVIHKVNEGAGLARNAGIDLATGQYIMFVDADDKVELDMCEKIYSIVSQYDLDVLRYRNDLLDENGTIEGSVQHDSVTVTTDAKNLKRIAACAFKALPKDLKDGFWPGCAPFLHLFKASVIKDNALSFYSERDIFGEDAMFNFEALQHVKRYGRIDYTFYHHRNNPQSLSNVLNMNRVRILTKFCEFSYQKFIDYGYSDFEALSYSSHFYTYTMRGRIKAVFLSDLPFQEKRRWFESCSKSSYSRLCYQHSPWREYPFKHRLCAWLFFHHCFLLYYFLIKAWDNVR